MTLMVGNPGETDEDCKATLDLLYEVERRGLFAFFVPSIFTPLHDTRLAAKQGVQESRELTPLQWQIMMKCWKMSLRPALHSWWGPTAWRVGALSRLAVETAQDERAEFHVAAAAVRQRASRMADGQDGQDLPRTAADGQEPQRTARHHQTAALEVPAAGQRRPSGRLGGYHGRAARASTLAGSIDEWIELTGAQLCRQCVTVCQGLKGFLNVPHPRR